MSKLCCQGRTRIESFLKWNKTRHCQVVLWWALQVQNPSPKRTPYWFCGWPLPAVDARCGLHMGRGYWTAQALQAPISHSLFSIFLCVLFLSSTFLCSIFCLQLFFCLFLLFFLNFCVKKFSPNFLSHNLLLKFLAPKFLLVQKFCTMTFLSKIYWSQNIPVQILRNLSA